MKTRLLITALIVLISATNSVASERVITLDFENNEVMSLSALPELSVPVIADIIGDNLSTSIAPIKNYVYGGLSGSNVNVIAKANKLYKDPMVVDDPLVTNGRVFWSGESVMRTVGISQWYAFSGLVFNFDKDMTTLSVNFSYLNDRAVCGKVNIIIQKVDTVGKVLWEKTWQIAGNTSNHTWKSYTLDKSRFTSLIAGKTFNRVMLIETDLQLDSFKGLVGSGYFDNVTISGDTLVPDVEVIEPVVLEQDRVIEDVVPVTEIIPTEPEIVINKSFTTDISRKLTVTCLGKDASYNHELYAEINGSSIFLFNSKQVGKVVNLGRFPVGTLVNFKLKVTTTGRNYYTGLPSNNHDGKNHVMITGSGSTWSFGFEDKAGGDWDYNDCLFEVSGVNLVNGTTEM